MLWPNFSHNCYPTGPIYIITPLGKCAQTIRWLSILIAIWLWPWDSITHLCVQRNHWHDGFTAHRDSNAEPKLIPQYILRIFDLLCFSIVRYWQILPIFFSGLLLTLHWSNHHINGLVWDCSISIANTPPSCTKPSIWLPLGEQYGISIMSLRCDLCYIIIICNIKLCYRETWSIYLFFFNFLNLHMGNKTE